MSSRVTEEDIDFSRGDEDIAFVHTEVDTSEISEKENPRQALLEEMELRGLKVENAEVIGIFREEFSLLLKDDARIILHGEEIFSRE